MIVGILTGILGALLYLSAIASIGVLIKLFQLWKEGKLFV